MASWRTRDRWSPSTCWLFEWNWSNQSLLWVSVSTSLLECSSWQKSKCRFSWRMELNLSLNETKKNHQCFYFISPADASSRTNSPARNYSRSRRNERYGWLKKESITIPINPQKWFKACGTLYRLVSYFLSRKFLSSHLPKLGAYSVSLHTVFLHPQLSQSR